MKFLVLAAMMAVTAFMAGCAATGGLPGYNAPKYKPIISPVPAMIPAGE